MENLKIATWNLSRLSPNSSRSLQMTDILKTIQPRVWVLTEVHADFKLDGYQKIADSGLSSELAGMGYWATVWIKDGISQDTKFPLRSADPERTASARVLIAEFPALNAYAAVLPRHRPGNPAA